jgi:hypothetical protein
MRGNRKDANQTIIVQALKRAGAVWVDLTDSASAGMDGLIAFRGQLLPAEIKDGNKPASARKLTSNEQKRKEELEYKGVKYNVIESVDDALRLIGAIK